MKNLWVILIVFLASCGGSLSDEQRKKFREGMEQQKIVKVSDAEVTSTAMDKGKLVYAALQHIRFDRSRLDSLEAMHTVHIRWIVPGTNDNLALENQLIEAYVLGMASGALQDNIQKVYTGTQLEAYDSVLYSKPVVSKMPDGADKLEGVWNIYMSKKDIILALGKKK